MHRCALRRDAAGELPGAKCRALDCSAGLVGLENAPRTGFHEQTRALLGGMHEQLRVACRHTQRGGQDTVVVGRCLFARFEFHPAGEQDDRLSRLGVLRAGIAFREVESGVGPEADQQAIGELDDADATIAGFEKVTRLDPDAFRGYQHRRPPQESQTALGKRDDAGFRRT